MKIRFKSDSKVLFVRHSRKMTRQACRVCHTGRISCRLIKQYLLIEGNFIKPSSLMFLRQTAVDIGLFNEKLRTAEDREFMVRLLRAGDFVYSPEPITQYRWHEENISQGKNARRNSENALRALRLIAGNAELALNPVERAACDKVITEAAAGYLYLSVCEGWGPYRQGLAFLAENFGRGLALRSWRPKHVLKLIVRN